MKTNWVNTSHWLHGTYVGKSFTKVSLMWSLKGYSGGYPAYMYQDLQYF